MMKIDRRTFLWLSAAGGAVAQPALMAQTTRPRYRAVAFDAFPVFDPRPIAALAETVFPGRGAALNDLWRTRQFEYQWLRALSGRYVDFWQATDESLTFAARSLALDLSADKRSRLMNAYLKLGAWPDAAGALGALKAGGVRLVFLTNMTASLIEAGVKNSGLDGIFEGVLSTDAIKTYKPDPRAYQLAMEALGLLKEQIVFAAFAGWDAAGARAFGYPTFWVNRLAAEPEELGAAPDATGRTLDDLVRFVTGSL